MKKSIGEEIVVSAAALTFFLLEKKIKEKKKEAEEIISILPKLNQQQDLDGSVNFKGCSLETKRGRTSKRELILNLIDG